MHLFHSRGIRVLKWIGREVLWGFMNIMIWIIMLTFISLVISLHIRSISTSTSILLAIWGFWSSWRRWSSWGIWSGVQILQWWCHEDIHLKIFKTAFGNPDFPQGRTIPAVSSNISSKYFTRLIFEHFIVFSLLNKYYLIS